MRSQFPRTMLISAFLCACPELMVSQETVLASKASVPKPRAQKVLTPQEKLTAVQNEVKQLLLLMDTDKNGKISKQEFIRFMQGEFEKLDRDNSGELDAKELARWRLRVSNFASLGK